MIKIFIAVLLFSTAKLFSKKYNFLLTKCNVNDIIVYIELIHF